MLAISRPAGTQKEALYYKDGHREESGIYGDPNNQVGIDIFQHSRSTTAFFHYIDEEKDANEKFLSTHIAFANI